MSKAPFPITPALTAIAIAYRNTALIADGVLPRVPVGKAEFKYTKYGAAESFTVPDTKVGRKSAPNKVDFSASEETASVQDYGLDDDIPQSDIDNAPENYDPKGRAVEGVADLIMLDREVRAANLVFTAENYPAGRKVQLAGNSQWSDFVNSNPISDVMAALDAPIFRPNVMVIGRAAFSKLIQHPKVAKAVLGNSGDVAIVTRQQLAALFELEEVLVGEGWVNTAKKGQAAVISRVWGKHASLLYRNKLADTQKGITFGITAEFGTRVAGEQPNPNIGLRGGVTVRAGESVKELIVASDVGYFIQDAVA